MANGKKGGHYEMVLEDRHLLGVFFAVVLLCAIFFTLGFVLGRNQAAAKPAAEAEKKPAPTAQQPASPSADDLSFYQRVEGKPPAETVPATKPPAPKTEPPPQTKPAPAASAASASTAPALYLQIAAVQQESDAKQLAARLQKLGFTAAIVPPRADRFYRVQVGPFETAELADAARNRLEAQGFRDVVKVQR